MDAPLGDEDAVGADSTPIVTRGCAIPEPSLGVVLDARDGPSFAWADGTETVGLVGAAATVTGTGPTRFEDVRAEGTRILESCIVGDVPDQARPRFFGGFAFHDETDGGDRWSGFPAAAFVLPEVQVTGVDGDWWLTATATGATAASDATDRLQRWQAKLRAAHERARDEPPGIASRRLTPTKAGWRDQVEDALARIAEGSLEKVVLAQSLTATLGGDLSIPAAFDRLGASYPDCYRFLFDPPDGGTFFGATPERLVSVRGRQVETTALAGSTRRGDSPDEDERLAAELAESEKLDHEHELVVDAIRDQLRPLAVDVRTGERSVQRLATIQHLRTEIAADMAADEHVLSLVDALHPTPAVGGLPPDAALRTIRETEAFDRGWYAAPIGWFDADGDGTFAVALRSALARDRTATLFAGNGIVADSDPDREYDEIQLKYHPMLDVLE